MLCYNPFILDVKDVAHAFLEVEVRPAILFCLFHLLAIPIAIKALHRLPLILRNNPILVCVLPCISFDYPGLPCTIKGTLVINLVSNHCYVFILVSDVVCNASSYFIVVVGLLGYFLGLR